MLIAVSSGVRAPRSRPIGLESRSISLSSTPASRSRASRSSWVRREPIAPTYATSGSRSATSSSGTSNFGSWVSTVITVRPSTRPASGLGGEVAVRPVDDDLVGLREAAVGREDGPGVAHGHVVAEEAADPGHRGREVDRAEDQHPRLRRERPHEHPHPLAAALAVRAVGQRRVVARRQQPERVVVDGVVGAGGAERRDSP